MAKKTELRVGKMEFRKADGSLVPWASLTPQEIAEIHAVWQKKLSEELSAYYSKHPEEYVRLSCTEAMNEKESAPGGHPSADNKTHNLQAGRSYYTTITAGLQVLTSKGEQPYENYHL